ncbi:DUF5134 domain-containing protein [Fodinicola feengrottensis]|uniref:DUF5134 domain-containing protein n=1 Tax=Fodinicola feengrottensis TaxID=435914 RepID=A0ABP4U4E0_9ACTN
MWLWTIVLLGVAGHCVARLVVAQRAHCAVDRTHNAIEAAMSAGMAAMVSPIGGPIPRAGWEAAFAVAVGWAAFSAGRSHSRRAWMWLRQAVAGGGMLYMLTTTEMPMSGTDMMQMSSAMVPAVTWTLVAYFGAVALWSLLPATGVRVGIGGLAVADGPPIRTAPLGPRAVSLCEAAMAAAMVVMLLSMH